MPMDWSWDQHKRSQDWSKIYCPEIASRSFLGGAAKCIKSPARVYGDVTPQPLSPFSTMLSNVRTGCRGKLSAAVLCNMREKVW